MTISGFAAMNPIATLAMVDIARWKPVVYADTPQTLLRYKSFLDDKKKDNRKVVLFLFGAIYLPEVLKHKDKFHSILVFDDLQNLNNMRNIPHFDIVDVDQGYPKYLSPSQLMDVVNKPTRFTETSLLSQVTRSLNNRRPSVLETTNRMPTVEGIPETGSQRAMSDLKALINDDVMFSIALDVYVKYVFRIVDRAYVTKEVTKKLPDGAKEHWKKSLDFADSEIGLAMAHAYRDLCRTTDPDLKASYLVNKYGIKNYGGDFLYFTSLLPPSHNCAFLDGTFEVDEKEPPPLVALLKAEEAVAKPKRGKAKSARP